VFCGKGRFRRAPLSATKQRYDARVRKMDRPLDALPEGTKVAGYVIGRVLGRGTFGITYLAADDLFPDRKYAIKEFLPAGIASRRPGDPTVHPTGGDRGDSFRKALASFRREALVLKELSHPNVVNVERYIELNGTAYMVMRYEDGISLDRALESGPLTEDEMRELMPPLLDGLEAIHAKNFVHRDVKPANIYLRRADHSPVLLDFGAAREAMGDAREKSLSEVLTPGYAPLEQYDRHSAQGPYTDIYALGATIYRCIAGRAPMEAISRHNAMRRGGTDPLVPLDRAVPGGCSPALGRAVKQAMEIDERKRPQSIAEWRAMLAAADAPAPRAAAPPPAPRRGETVHSGVSIETIVQAPLRRRGGARWILAGVAALAVCAAAFAAYRVLAPSGVPAAGPAAEIKRANPGVAPPPADRAQPDRMAANNFRDCPQCPELVRIPAGRFQMGSTPNDDSADEDETPRHDVTIAKPFALGKYEVTFAEWEVCVRAKACTNPGNDNDWGRGRQPVVSVTWNDAKQYVAWLSRETGKKYRLPSEAEWERAARAGKATRYAWGNEIGSNRANCESCGSQWDGKRTAPVGSFPANEYGLHDMAGNVWEWVEDCWSDNHRGAPADGKPRLTGQCERRVMRSGSWNNHPNNVRPAAREPMAPENESYDIGFRLARELE